MGERRNIGEYRGRKEYRDGRNIALKDYIVEHDLDFLALTETWLRSGDIDNYHIEEFCPTGYVFHHIPRSISRVGGVGLLKKTLPCKETKCNKIRLI